MNDRRVQSLGVFKRQIKKAPRNVKQLLYLPENRVE